MPNQHKTKSITWHPADPTLKDRIKAVAERRETSASRILDEGMTEHLDRLEAGPRPDLSRLEAHHKDGDPRNNDPGNIELRKGGEVR